MSASTVTLTTMSVSESACTTGSTDVVPSFTPLKIGGPPPWTYPTERRSTYVDDCVTVRHTARWMRFRLVTIPYSPTAHTHAATAYGRKLTREIGRAHV